MVWLFIKLVLALVVIFILLGFGRTWQMEHSPAQQAFAKGIIPHPLPDGFLAGSVSGKTSWLGKKFAAAQMRGINVFDAGNGAESERYPFVMSTGAGVRDAKMQVVKIDYEIPGNPFWLRRILDEVVEIAPGHYLGKLHVRIIPGIPFTLGYFDLKQ